MIPRALPLWAAAAAVGLLPLHAAQAASSVKFPDKVCDITHYGAEGQAPMRYQFLWQPAQAPRAAPPPVPQNPRPSP